MATPAMIDHIRREGPGNAWIVARIQRQNDIILNSSLPGSSGEPYAPFRLGPNATPQQLKDDLANYAEARVKAYVAYLARTSEPGVTVQYGAIKPIAMSADERARWGAHLIPNAEMVYGDPTQQPPPSFRPSKRQLWGNFKTAQQ